MKNWQPVLDVLKDMLTDYINFIMVCVALAIFTPIPVDGIDEIILHRATAPYLVTMLVLRIIYAIGCKIAKQIKKPSLETV